MLKLQTFAICIACYSGIPQSPHIKEASHYLESSNTKNIYKAKAKARGKKREENQDTPMMKRVTKGSCKNGTSPKIQSLDQNESLNRSKSCMSQESFVQKEPLSMSESCASKGPKSDHKQANSEIPIFGRKIPSSLSETSGLKGSTPRTELSGREKLKRHRVEMAGRVWIPDVWGQEGLLKDWAENCTSFDAMKNSSLVSARAALVQEGRIRANSSLRIENSC